MDPSSWMAVGIAVSLPLYVAVTSHWKRPLQLLALWVYVWSIGALSFVILWRGYQRDQYCRQILGEHGSDLLNQSGHILWILAGLLVLMMAAPPVWYLRERKRQVRSAE